MPVTRAEVGHAPVTRAEVGHAPVTRAEVSHPPVTRAEGRGRLRVFRQAGNRGRSDATAPARKGKQPHLFLQARSRTGSDCSERGVIYTLPDREAHRTCSDRGIAPVWKEKSRRFGQ